MKSEVDTGGRAAVVTDNAGIKKREEIGLEARPKHQTFLMC